MVQYLFYILFAILPLIFYPKTSEVFEFNKIVIVYIFTTLITTTWIVKMIQTKKVLFKRTLLDIPLLLFLGSQLISTLFSIDARTSIFGYYGRFNGGLLSLICYSLLYWAFVSNLDKINSLKLIKTILISATLVAIYGIFEHFGYSPSCLLVTGKFNVDCWVQDVQTRVFATLGQPNWLASLLVALTPLALINVLKTKQTKTKIFYIAISVIFLLCILFTKSRSGLLGLIAAIEIVIWSIIFANKHKGVLLKIFSFAFIAIHGFILFSLASIFISSIYLKVSFPDRFNEIISQRISSPSNYAGEGGTESGDIRAIVWKGAIDIWKAYPLFGTGPETFAFSYWQYRPVEHNNTSEWDFLYNKAHNEYLNIAANTGTIGLFTYLVLIGGSIYVLRKNSALLAGYISILITNFFGFSVVNISLISFIFPAIAVTLNVKTKKEEYKTTESGQNVLIAGVVVASVFILFLISRYWYADFKFSKGRQEYNLGNYEESISNLQNAINYIPTEAIYHNELSRVFTNITGGLLDRDYSTDASKFASLALGESDKAFDLSGRNINIRETRVNTFLQLSEIRVSYLMDAINLTKETIEYSPTDPKLYLILGKSYANVGELEKSKAAFEKALELKPDYIDAKKDLEVIENIEK